MNFKKSKVILLPTDQNPTPISIGNESKIGEYHQFLFGKKEGIYNNHTFQHLYINSDDEIKEGDWIITNIHNKIEQVLNNQTSLKFYQERAKKVIATTDTYLYKLPEKPNFNSYMSFSLGNPLPQPSQQFIQKYIEEYNKGNIITDVLVEYEDIIYNPEKDREYQSNDRINIEDCDKLSRLKINPKDNTITIKTIKDCWNREEQIDVIEKYLLTKEIDVYRRTKRSDIKKWVEENL